MEKPPPHRLAPGHIWDGRYRVIDLLGEGGFATVYRAEHIHMRRNVALKILDLLPKGTDVETFNARFAREAETAARVQHANVVQVYDFGVSHHEGRPYLVMELLEGHDLDDDLRVFGPMSAERVKSLFLPVLEALGQAHAQQIVHKDLKPSNLFITFPGTQQEVMVVLDFGIARTADADAKLTATGQLYGTPQYLAPEYIEAQTVTPALDVYQMALIMVEMFTGLPVLDASNPFQCMLGHSRGALSLPRYLLDGPLGPVLRGALALDYRTRIPDAATFKALLEEVNWDALALPEPNVRHTMPTVMLNESSGEVRSYGALAAVADQALAYQNRSGPRPTVPSTPSSLAQVSSGPVQVGSGPVYPARDSGPVDGNASTLGVDLAGAPITPAGGLGPASTGPNPALASAGSGPVSSPDLAVPSAAPSGPHPATSEVSPPPMDAPRPSRAWVGVVIALVALVLGGVGVAAVVSGGDDAPQQPTSAEAEPVPKAAGGGAEAAEPPKAAEPAERAEAAKAAEPPKAVEPPKDAEPAQVTIDIASDPKGATVEHKGIALGQTPYAWNTPQAEGDAELVLRLEGHTPKTIRVSLDRSQPVEVTLDDASPTPQDGAAAKASPKKTTRPVKRPTKTAKTAPAEAKKPKAQGGKATGAGAPTTPKTTTPRIGKKN